MKFALLVVACALVAPAALAQEDLPTAARIAELVERLDAPRFLDREEALAELSRMGVGIVPLLEAHREHPSLEARTRVLALIEAMHLDSVLGGLDGAPRELLEALSAADPHARSARVRELVLRARPTDAFARLLDLARTSRSREVVRAALEGLSRVGAPRMATRLEAHGIASFSTEPVAVTAHLSSLFEGAVLSEEVRARLTELTVPPASGGRPRQAFGQLIALADTFDFAFALDPERDQIHILSPAAAIERWATWVAGPGREALAWDDFVRDRIGHDAQALATESRAEWTPRLTDPDPVVRRKAAYILGRTPGAEADLAAARAGASEPAHAYIDQAIDRAQLRNYGTGFMISDRSGRGQLYHMRLDGAPPTALTDEASRAYYLEASFDGTHLAYRFGDWRLAVVAVATGKVWRAADRHCHRAAWSADGKTLAYELRDDEEGARCELFLHRVEGGADVRLGVIAPDPYGRFMLPTWSPNGLHIAYTEERPEGRALSVRTASGAELAASVRYPGLRGPRWTGDQELLAIVEGGAADRLVRIAVDGTPRGVALGGFAAGQILQVDLSPDRTSAIVVQQPGPDGSPSTYLLRLDGSRPVRLGDIFCAVAWTQAGDQVAVVADGTARVLDASGAPTAAPALKLTTTVAGGARPHWGPGGKVLYVTEHLSGDGKGSRVKVHALDGPTWRSVSELRGWGSILDITPDGAWLLAVADGTGDREIYAISAADGRTLNLTEHPASDDGFQPRFSRMAK